MMGLPFKLQKLPDEAISVLRYMGGHDGLSVAEMEEGADLTNRMAMRAVRRLVNDDFIEMRGRTYFLTTDGRLAARQLDEFYAVQADSPDAPPDSQPHYATISRRLVVVVPRAFAPDVATMLFVGVNPPEPGTPRLMYEAQIAVKISAVGGILSTYSLGLDVPPDQAAKPARLSLTPAQAGRSMRVRIDAAQVKVDGSEEPLGGMYFDVKVTMTAASSVSSVRALGMDILLRA